MAEDAIRSAARALLERDRGASLDQVAREAGVSRATVYRLFGSRAGLLRALDLEPDPGARDRVLAAALALIGRDGLARLSMDELAAEAGVSRASLYRLFPGKAALFRGLLLAYSPLETVVATINRMRDRPPAEVMPAIARRVVQEMESRAGIARTLLFEMTGAVEDTSEAADYLISTGIGTLIAYLTEQMAAGRLRPMHPLLAVQAFAGPILFHLITRSALERLVGLDMPAQEAAAQFADQWVRAMRPEEG